MPTSSLLRKFSNRRRPKPCQAKLLKNNILAEEESYSIDGSVEGVLSAYNPTSLPRKTPKKSLAKSSLMQRFSNWIGEHLAGRAKRRDHSSRRDSDAAHRRPEIVVGPFVDSVGVGGRKVPRMFGDLSSSSECPYTNGPTSNSYHHQQQQQSHEVKRRAVCTNPWFFPPPESARSALMSTSLSRNTDLLDASYSSSLSQLTRDESLRINTLAGSACSSGYGSNDSSPECSVHQPSWQPSTQIQNRGNLVDKAVECHSLDLDDELGILPIEEDYNHIYYELELNSRGYSKAAPTGESCYSGSIELNADQFTGQTSTTSNSSRADSPIYAIPCSSSAGESPCGSIDYADDSDGYAELARRHSAEASAETTALQTSSRGLVEYNSNGYARLQKSTTSFACCPQVPRLPPPQFHAPPPPPQSQMDGEFPRSCLDLLDEQIAELKHKTEVVSRLVETAKEQRELRDLARSLCLEHIQNLRSMRLFVESGFELHI